MTNNHQWIDTQARRVNQCQKCNLFHDTETKEIYFTGQRILIFDEMPKCGEVSNCFILGNSTYFHFGFYQLYNYLIGSAKWQVRLVETTNDYGEDKYLLLWERECGTASFRLPPMQNEELFFDNDEFNCDFYEDVEAVFRRHGDDYKELLTHPTTKPEYVMIQGKPNKPVKFIPIPKNGLGLYWKSNERRSND